MEYKLEASSIMERAYSTALSFPFLYIISKSTPYIFYTHFCYSFDDNICFKKYFKLSWFVLNLKFLPMRYCHHFFIACKIVSISFSYVDFTKSFSLNCLLSKSNGLPSCINTTPIPCLDPSRSNMNVLPKLGVANTGVEDMESFKSENVNESSSFHTNQFLFKRDVSGPAMCA
jgi:hypothetical protein